MKILAHRGLWENEQEYNTLKAIRRALQDGFGVETDIRDAGGTLVLSHDPQQGAAPEVGEMFDLYQCLGSSAPLALNIKSDGLAAMLFQMIEKAKIQEYFCFDMSVPQMLAYARNRLNIFTRESEIEPQPVLYSESKGVWVDLFYEDWVTTNRIEEHLNRGKLVALVSPELHKRPHLEFWSRLKSAGLGGEGRLSLCTDFPMEARDFFND